MIYSKFIFIPLASRDFYIMVDGVADKAFREYFIFGIRVARMSRSFEFTLAKLKGGLK